MLLIPMCSKSRNTRLGLCLAEMMKIIPNKINSVKKKDSENKIILYFNMFKNECFWTLKDVIFVISHSAHRVNRSWKKVPEFWAESLSLDNVTFFVCWPVL